MELAFEQKQRSCLKRRAQKQRRERHGKKRRVQPLPEGMEMKPLHAPASVPR